MAFRHMSWEQRARRIRRRKQRRVAAAAVTLAGGQLAWMVTRGATPVEALEANRLTSLQSFTGDCSDFLSESCIAVGGVTDVDVSDDGQYVAFVTSESLLPEDDDDPSALPQFRLDVYVRGPGGLRLITDVTHPDGDQFWTIGSEVAISGDGTQIAWTMRDESIVFFYPVAVDPTASNDDDGDLDVFVAEVDDDDNGDLADGAAGSPMLASEGLASLDATSPTLSADGRHVAFELDGPDFGSGSLGDVRLHDRDPDGDGFDGADQSTVVVPAGGFPRSDSPAIGGTGGEVFVVLRATGLPEGGNSHIRWWRPGLADSVDVTSGAFTGGTAGTDSSDPSVSADGSRVAYEFETADDSIVSDIPFGRNQAVVVEIDPGNGAPVLTDPDGDGPELPTYGYIASQDPTDPDPTTRIGDSTSDTTPVLSADGRYVAFESNADNFAGVIGSGAGHIYAVDLLQTDPVDRVPVLVSADQSGNAGDDGSFLPAISATGEYIAFASTAENLTPGLPTPQYDGSANAFLMSWRVNVFGEPVAFPDTAVGSASAPLTLRFDTDDFGPWTASAMDFLDGYVDPAEHDFVFTGTCVGFVWHANQPCEIQVVFAPQQIGDRVAEACVRVEQAFDSCATATVGGEALVPDGIGPLVRESVDSDEAQYDDNSAEPVISANGRYIAFTTDEPLDPADNNFMDDVYVRDRLRGTTTLISGGAGLGPGLEFESDAPTISGDGQFIAFVSAADKADEPTGGNDNGSCSGEQGCADVFRVDRGAPDANGDFTATPTMVLVSVDTVNGADAGIFDDVVDPSISGDGTQIAFTVDDVEGDVVMIRDLAAGRTVEAPVDSAFDIVSTSAPALSADGRHLAYVAGAFIGGATFPQNLVYAYDRDVDGNGVNDTTLQPTDTTRTVLITTDQFTPLSPPDDTRQSPLENTNSGQPAISGDGSTIAYAFSQFYDFNVDDPIDERLTALPFDTSQIVVADRDPATGAPLASEIVSIAGPGDPAKSAFQNLAENAGQCLFGGEGCHSVAPDISDDGRYVTFGTAAENLVVRPARSLPGSTGSFCGQSRFCDIVAVDRLAPSNAAAPQHVNIPPTEVLEEFAAEDRRNGAPTISADGRFIAFDSDAEYLLGYAVSPLTGQLAPVDSNNLRDVFLREWQPVVDPSLPVVFPDTQVGATSPAQTASFSTQDFGPSPIISGLELLGANPGDFLIIPEASVNCAPALGTGPADAVPPVPVHARVHLSDGCSVPVAFRPTALGVRTATLRVTVGHPFSVGGPTAQTVDIPLSGGGAGQGEFGAPGSVDLGSQIVETASPQGTIIVTNNGNIPFQITGVAVGGANPGDFAIIDTNCVGFLAPGASCTTHVTFKPTAPGERSATLVFTTTLPGGSRIIGLTGRAPFPTLILNPGVVVAGRTVQIQGLNWTPGVTVTITTADAFRPNDPAAKFPERLELIANAFGGIEGSLLLFPKSANGPRIVIADGPGAPPALSAFQPLLVSVSTVSGVDFVSRG